MVPRYAPGQSFTACAIYRVRSAAPFPAVECEHAQRVYGGSGAGRRLARCLLRGGSWREWARHNARGMSCQSPRGDCSHSRTQEGRVAAVPFPRCHARTRCRRLKLDSLLRHLRRHGCVIRREGKEHSLWENPQTGHAEAVPRHIEIANLLAKRICRRLSIPDPPG